MFAAAAAKLLQSYLTLCIPIDGSPPGSGVPGILQARTLKWVAISFSNAWKWKVKVKSLSHVPLFANPWTAAYQAPLSVGFSRQEYWSGLLLPKDSVRSNIRQNWEKANIYSHEAFQNFPFCPHNFTTWTSCYHPIWVVVIFLYFLRLSSLEKAKCMINDLVF